ncbi:GtrA family protein [Pseudazoarcus pumilus]|nr:GtrA family protein [Pseudazoarcus pumilus]
MPKVSREFSAYFACSAAALGVDYATYWTVARNTAASLEWAAVIGYGVGMVVAYALLIRFVFPQGWLRSRRKLEATLFALTGLLGLLLTYVSVALVVSLLGEHLHTAKIVAAGVSFTGVFVVRKLVVFRSEALNHNAP